MGLNGRQENRRGASARPNLATGKRYLHCFLSHGLGKRLNVKERSGEKRRSNDKNDESFRRFLFQEEFVRDLDVTQIGQDRHHENGEWNRDDKARDPGNHEGQAAS